MKRIKIFSYCFLIAICVVFNIQAVAQPSTDKAADPEELSNLRKEIEKNPATQIKIDLEKQEIEILSTQEKESFDINPYKKTCMINGYDDIDFLLSLKDKIEEFELK